MKKYCPALFPLLTYAMQDHKALPHVASCSSLEELFEQQCCLQKNTPQPQKKKLTVVIPGLEYLSPTATPPSRKRDLPTDCVPDPESLTPTKIVFFSPQEATTRARCVRVAVSRWRKHHVAKNAAQPQ